MINDEKLVWDLLMEEIKNPYGVAGLMGNLMAESSMNPINATGNHGRSSAQEYVNAVKDGSITPEEFAHDGVAFGLAQWRFWSRKAALLSFAGIDKFDDLATQVAFLLTEIKTYKAVWETLLNARTVTEASDVVLLKYEKPANVGVEARTKRTTYSLAYYKLFNELSVKKYVRTTADKVLFRSGNGKSYSVVDRAEKAGTYYEWIATSSNGWYAVAFQNPKQVAWVTSEYSELVYK